MVSRTEIANLLHQLYDARVRGDLKSASQLFTDAARFEIASASHGNPVAVGANGTSEFLPLLTLLMRAFRVSDLKILSMIIEGDEAAVHWRAAIYSKITGSIVVTEFMDIVKFEDSRISSYTEFFIPR